MSNPRAGGGSKFVRGLIAFEITSSCTLKTVWERELASVNGCGTCPFSSPFVAGEYVWLVTGEFSHVVAIDKVTGAVAWNFDDSINGALLTQPTILPNVVLVTGEGSENGVNSGAFLQAFSARGA